MPTPTLPLAGRIVLITGANTGIGRETALRLARLGARCFLACRSQSRTQPVIDQIGASCPDLPAEWLPLDLADFDSVQACAHAFLARDLPLHLLVNNAGLGGRRGYTRSGFELAFGVNHMGHFLLTRLLRARIEQSSPARIVNVASRAHGRVRSIDWAAVQRPSRGFFGAREYCVSKLANVLFSAELGRRLRGRGVSTYALHPGVIGSDFWRSLPAPLHAASRLVLTSPEAGARTTLHCAVWAPADESSLYYADCRREQPSAAARDGALAAALWQRSEAWIQARGFG